MTMRWASSISTSAWARSQLLLVPKFSTTSSRVLLALAKLMYELLMCSVFHFTLGLPALPGTEAAAPLRATASGAPCCAASGAALAAAWADFLVLAMISLLLPLGLRRASADPPRVCRLSAPGAGALQQPGRPGPGRPASGHSWPV